MANFVALVDPDSERRTRFAAAAEPSLPFVQGLTSGRCEKENCLILWAAGSRAPVSSIADEKGCAVIWGQAIPGPGPETIDAAGLRDSWNGSNGQAPASFDGFHAAVVYDQTRGLKVGADILGCFPVYYWSEGDVALVGSSPELFRYHPSFRMSFNPAGLVGLLLLGHVFQGETLWRGVRRLAAGHVATRRGGEEFKEVPQFTLPVSDRYFGLPFSSHVDILDKMLEEVIARHTVPGNSYGQMLSGGRDSRLISGFLHRRGTKVTAFTIGASNDIEMLCAKGVAETLGFPHHAGDVSFDGYAQYAELTAKWEHLANGFQSLALWNILPRLHQLPPYVAMSYNIDPTIGGSLVEKAYSRSTRTFSFENYWAYLNRYGIRPEVLQHLLRKEVFGELVGDTMAEVRRAYETSAGLEFQWASCFALHHRLRFYIGAAAWRYCFGAWPVWPALDRQLLAVVLGMPAATLGERRAQDELLRRKFPELAALPLDRNSFDTTPLHPRLRYQVLAYIKKRARKAGESLGWKPNTDINRLYYYRLFDFNGPGWAIVRQHAEPYRDRVLDIFNRDALDAQLPPPQVVVDAKNAYDDSNASKMLLGFMLWSRDHL